MKDRERHNQYEQTGIRTIVVAKPVPSEGIGQALRAAYSPRMEDLPRDIADYLARLS